MGKCVNCGKSVDELSAEPVKIDAPSGQWRGATFSCTHCGVVLGAGIDPVLLQELIVDEVNKKLAPLLTR